MTTLLIVLAIVVWLACPVLCWGLFLGCCCHDRSEKLDRYDYEQAALVAGVGLLCGPVGLLICWGASMHGTQGLRFK